MKVALCFNGLVGTTKGKSHEGQGDPRKCFEISSELYLKHIISKNDVDVFIHSWSEDLKKEILEAYKPKKYIIEKQKIFDIPKHISGKSEGRKQTHYSLWYSRKKVIELKNEYEKENNVKYDCVMLARFDLAWQSDLIFDKYDPKYFWTGQWPKKFLNGKILKDVDYWKLKDKEGLKFETLLNGYPHNNGHKKDMQNDTLLGTWFFSNVKNMDKFATMYDMLGKYSLPNRCPYNHEGELSAHHQSLYHLRKIGLVDRLKFCDKNWYDDFGIVRRRYFKVR